MKRKTSRHDGVPHPTGIQSIDLMRKSIGGSLYDKDLQHEIINIIWNSVTFKVVFQMFSNV